MKYEYNINSENTIIYTNLNLKNNDALITFCLYHKLLKEIFSIVKSVEDAKLSHSILKKELYKYSSETTSLDKKIDYKEFILGYLNYIKDNEELNEILDFYSLSNSYIDSFNDTKIDLSLIKIINNKSLSFGDKSNLFIMIDDYLDSVFDFIYDINGEDNSNKIINELSIIITSFIDFIDTDYFDIHIFNYHLKKITLEFIKEKIKNNELDLNKIENENLLNLYNSFDGIGKSILKFSFPYVISDFVDYIDPFIIIEEAKRNSGMSSINFNKEINKFNRKYRKIRKYYNNLEKSNNIKKLTKNNK